MSAGTDALGDASRGVPIPFAKKLLVQIGAFVSLTIVCLALWVVYRTLQSIQLSDVLEQFERCRQHRFYSRSCSPPAPTSW